MNTAARTIDPTSDAAIAASVTPRPIEEIGDRLGVPAAALYRYGPDKAKIALDFARKAEAKADGRLILVTAINPTPAGEGKTTTTIGLGDALARAGKRVAIALREPSLGPVFGSKGGATGGGHAQIVPMQDINLHFTGDFHAISAAHNLLAATIDNHIYWGNALDIDTRRINWRRVVDLNDRALRSVVVGLGGPGNGFPREDGFDITVASEVMAIFCLARSLEDLEERLGRMVVAQNRARQPITAGQLKVTGAMTALLRDAFQPNLVQTLEATPAVVHGGPFANIAHGCNSVMATRTALGLADYVVTEAGFGADLGAEKFLDIKCRQAGLTPSVVVIVATVRALKMHGGVAQKDLGAENVAAVSAGTSNLVRHIENMKAFGLPAVVAINRFTGDTAAEIDAIRAACAAVGASVHLCSHWADGSAGAVGLAEEVAALAAGPSAFRPLYASELPLLAKIEAIATRIYRAGAVAVEPGALRKLGEFEAQGHGDLPICMAKTQYSFSADPTRRGAPEGFVLPVRDVRLSAGAGFVVALCGDVMTMPGLPSRPAAEDIFVDETGFIGGVF
ncbi:formate--tetrahydrofolate ligase [Ancylobacter dichloromethanicus]|uniref:Formate--tetrahydrofolate ligase n=1 Tax=Ancylobacter dichloromethanicus TaxID=518825 RepID=A0A9W6J875_9HYPH|nr:formate--tetrahydrofolate ligase [Ancylobacter dichloromethanicus]MBS7554059.1 formate--tetrahydrofolate ligase [Ancylobacter dichloromethanicus]GLK71174.1 formate--tetrahydrofolate ligase [Ancylobacter dichloromethanicus]